MYLQILMHIFTLGFHFQCMISENKCISAHIHTLFEDLNMKMGDQKFALKDKKLQQTGVQEIKE